MPSPQVYRGSVRKLVLGIDVGTTFSGVSYAVLDPGEDLSIHGITRYPGQENYPSNSKIPSILYYRQDGTLHSAGAEAKAPGMDMVAEDENLLLVEWFKLHLRPRSLDTTAISSENLPPLPAGKTVVDVFADFLRYLFQCARRYISENHVSGESLLNSVKDRIEFVLSHPNGWEGLQQRKMRQAAIIAGLVPDTAAGRSRIHFVTEGEASLNFCIKNKLAGQDMESVIIVDAGGGTVDISSYLFVSTSPMSVEEAAPPDCILQGSTRVNVRLEEFLRGSHFASSPFATEGDIKAMLNHFDESAKLVFKDENQSSYIKFGSAKDNDRAVNIRNGQLMLSGSDMVSFFKPALQSISNAIQAQRDGASCALSTVFFVGGFAANPWLYSSLKKKLEARNVVVYRPDSPNKAVADGSVSFYLDHFVSSRVTKVTYGVEICVKYHPDDPEHFARRYQKFFLPDGSARLPNGFSTILRKGTHVRDKEEISHSFCQEARESRTLNSISGNIICYRGSDTPAWVDIDPEMFAPLCTIYADTSQVARHAKLGTNGVYYVQKFDVLLLCGMTEMQAQISWVENGTRKKGPAKIVYEDDLQISR